MTRPDIVGNKWVLAGAVTYLLEWVAIIPAGDTGPADPGSSRAQVLQLYRDHPKAVLFITTWCSLVLLGRVLIVTGVRSAVRSTGAESPLLDLAVVAMGVSVAIELLSVIAVGAAQALAVQGLDSAVLMLDALGGLAFACILPPLGLSIGLSAYAMLRTRAFPTWIPVLGCLAGLVLVVGGVAGGPGYVEAGTVRNIGNAAALGVPLFWIWMLSTGVFLARRAPRVSRHGGDTARGLRAGEFA